MKILFVGDVVGRAGRELLIETVPKLREELDLDVVIVNGENAAGGFGITQRIAETFYEAGVDLITTGNHVWDQRELLGTINGDPRMIRPLNLSPDTPGRGITAIRTQSGKTLVLAQVLGRIHMKPVACPFRALDAELTKYPLGGSADAIVIDVHAEITAEKQALGHYLDGRVSLVVGTHTHTPTADARILSGGTAYITDVGMCGAYDSVIGMEKQASIKRFLSDVPGARMEPAHGPATLSAVAVETKQGGGAEAIRHLVRGTAFELSSRHDKEPASL
ncbi:MAG: TIGR00282 family metallophosphoesterase [Geminicoccaceae bacterium]